MNLVAKTPYINLPVTKPEYSLMLKNIQDRMPAILRDSSNFHKSHSQFMQVTVDITSLTPVRSVMHILAEIDRTKMALQEAYINLKKKQIEKKKKESQLSKSLDEFDRELIEIEIVEIDTYIENVENSVQGAIRKMNFLVNQHKLLLEKIGKNEITEEDYEREETRYHIMTAMKQALNASRSRGGIIDEGNFIYLFELGISAAEAQLELTEYLRLENELIQKGRSPTHEMTLRWLEACADKWQNEPAKFAARRGFSTFDDSSLNKITSNDVKTTE